jgi:antitoxin component of MazEF toxin-antitoxin module
MEIMKLHEIRAVKVGGSTRISLPPDWTKNEGVSEGTTLDVLESGILVIMPGRELSDDEITESFENIKKMIKIAYRNRSSKKVKR